MPQRLAVLLSLLILLAMAVALLRPGVWGSGATRSDSIAAPTRQHEGFRSHTNPAGEASENREGMAKVKYLFVGNSHTGFFNLPELVVQLINHRMGVGQAMAAYIAVTWLDQAPSTVLGEIESNQWDAVILQAQKISSSGKYLYPIDAGVQLGKLAINHNCQTYFFSEWGLQHVPNHSRFTESIYQAMADVTGGKLIPVGRAWEAVLAVDPQINLYSSDSNHQSRLGASLTALVIASYLLRESATALVAFDDPEASDQQWALFVREVAKLQAEDGVGLLANP